MVIELKAVSLSDGQEIYDMIVEIGPGENGFVNNRFNVDYSEFSDFIKDRMALSRGDDLPQQYVPQTNYWLLKAQAPN